jgi:hypothetical protein
VKKKNIVILIFIGVIVSIVFGLILLSPSENTGRDQIYHARIAEAKQYKNGIFSDSFPIKKGTYEIRFVLNGDSPEKLSVTMKGSTFSFSENYRLDGTIHGEFGKYYTWKYLGSSKIDIPQDQELKISMDPHGSLEGPFSIYIIR